MKSWRRWAAWEMFRRYNGEYLTLGGTGGENPAGAQCTNVPNTFWMLLGVPALYGDAGSWAGTSDHYRRWVPLYRMGRLSVGDVAVFAGGRYSPVGHVALCLDATRSLPLWLDQDDPTGDPVSAQEYDRADMLGVIRLRDGFRWSGQW